MQTVADKTMLHTDLVQKTKEINQLLRRYGVKFGIYKNGVFNEQFFPFDPIPRVISHADFQQLESGFDSACGCPESISL